MNIKIFYYILESVKDDLQGYSSFRKCTEAEAKLTIALWYALVIVVVVVGGGCTGNVQCSRKIARKLLTRYSTYVCS
jgi:hypothetical protein